MRTRRLLGIGTLTGVLAVALLGLGVAPASAHNAFVSSNPTADSVVTEQPGTFVVTTNDALLEAGGTANAIQVRGPGAEPLYYGDGCMTVNGSSLSTPVSLGQPGEYTVIWQVVSADGHPIDGEFTFTWQPADGQELTAGVAAPPVCGESSAPAESGTPTPEPTFTTQTDTLESSDAVAPEETSTAPGDILWIGAALGVLVLAAVVVLIVVRRRNTKPGAAGTDVPHDSTPE